MFTGIIDHCGTLVKIETIPHALRFWIKHAFKESLTLGESIAINGICLTVTQIQHDIFCCDLSPETLQVTTAKNFKTDQLINLERALQPTSRFGGHFVMGHIDQTARVFSIQPISDFISITFTDLDQEAMKYIVKKGSIAIDGVSLTINEVMDNGFSVMLIPHTLKCTNLMLLRENNAVNIEFDMLARMVVKQIENITR